MFLHFLPEQKNLANDIMLRWLKPGQVITSNLIPRPY